MITLCMEASHRVSSVIDNLKFTLLVIISVSAVENTIGVALLISELSVISVEENYFYHFCSRKCFLRDSPYSSIITKSVTMRSSLTMNLERNLLWLIVGFLKLFHFTKCWCQKLSLTPWYPAAAACTEASRSV